MILTRQAVPTRYTIPLLVCGLLLTGAIASSWVAYVELRRAALTTARERLRDVTTQLAELLVTSTGGFKRQAARLSAHPSIVQYLQSPSVARSSAAARVMDSVARQGESLVAVELWDVDGRRRLAAGAPQPAVEPEAARQFAGGLTSGDSAVVGPFRAVADSAVYLTAAPVYAGDSAIGYAVHRRRIGGSSDGSRRIRDLIGPGVSLFVGNEAGDVWTDLSHIVAGPPVAVTGATDTLLHYERPDAGSQLAAVESIPGTPWLVLLEFPRAPILAGARRVAGRLAAINAGLAALGLALAWTLTRRLTKPFGKLADAAGAIAKGEYSRRLTMRHGDELGELAAAFNSMAEHVEQARHRLEQQVAERTAELQVANEELEAFSYSVSHDLRAPLRSIDGFCQALLEDSADALDDVGREHLGRVRTASQHMAQLIDDLLDLSRVTRADLNREPVNLTALAEDIVAQLTKSETRRPEVVVAPDLRGQGDRRLLRIVLENLIGNAWKFTARRPDARIEVGVERDDGHSIYYVSDNGAGFEMTYVGKLFTPFQRLHGPAEFEGTGIGLATVQRIVHRHGGRVWAEGAVNEGATIRFTLDDAVFAGGASDD